MRIPTYNTNENMEKKKGQTREHQMLKDMKKRKEIGSARETP